MKIKDSAWCVVPRSSCSAEAKHKELSTKNFFYTLAEILMAAFIIWGIPILCLAAGVVFGVK